MEGTYIVADYDHYILSTSKEYVKSRMKSYEHISSYTFTGDYILYGENRLMYVKGFNMQNIWDIYKTRDNIPSIFMNYKEGAPYLELPIEKIKTIVDLVKGIH